MILEVPAGILKRIQAHGEQAYPDEGAGLLLGKSDANVKHVIDILRLANIREGQARRTRYLLSAEDYLQGEAEADRRGLEVLGVFHSHPDHPNRPSEFDREWAWPSFTYIITSVWSGRAADSRAWCLADGRDEFVEETLRVEESKTGDGPGRILA